MSYFVDVHTHLTHAKFDNDRNEVIKRSVQAGLKAIVVNGLEPISNLQILELSKHHPEIIPAWGIYPVDAVCHKLPDDFPWYVPKFNVEEAIQSISEKARNKEIQAIGECGLDGYWLDPSTYSAQERVFEQLIEIGRNNDLPIIVHTRKMEKRAFEILAHHQVKKVNFHCYGGKTKLAIQYAEKFQWYFSIPPNAGKNQSFQKLLKELPKELILTETDAPFLAPERGTRNEPINVIKTIALMAELRSMDINEAKTVVWTNYQRLFF